MSAFLEEVPTPLDPLRCHACGTIMGYTTQRNLSLTQLWCSPECRDIPVGQRNENNPRDELMVELQAAGVPLRQLTEAFGITRQGVTQIIDRRTGRKPYPRQKPFWEPDPTPTPKVINRRGRINLQRRGKTQ